MCRPARPGLGAEGQPWASVPDNRIGAARCAMWWRHCTPRLVFKTRQLRTVSNVTSTLHFISSGLWSRYMPRWVNYEKKMYGALRFPSWGVSLGRPFGLEAWFLMFMNFIIRKRFGSNLSGILNFLAHIVNTGRSAKESKTIQFAISCWKDVTLDLRWLNYVKFILEAQNKICLTTSNELEQHPSIPLTVVIIRTNGRAYFLS